MLKEGRIKLGDKVSFIVPTGNFGDILAGYYAMSMGLPVKKLVCASNTNNVLTDFLNTGVYDRNREFFKTISPSMDILISSNLERLLYHITGNQAQVARWMKELADCGRYDVGAEVLAKIKEVFSADWSDDNATKGMIKKEYDMEG
jgi:threonine synthase